MFLYMHQTVETVTKLRLRIPYNSFLSRILQIFNQLGSWFEWYDSHAYFSQLARSSFSVSNGDAGSSPVPANFAEIVVVRHGETTWNASGKIQVSFIYIFIYIVVAM